MSDYWSETPFGRTYNGNDFRIDSDNIIFVSMILYVIIHIIYYHHYYFNIMVMIVI